MQACRDHLNPGTARPLYLSFALTISTNLRRCRVYHLICSPCLSDCLSVCVALEAAESHPIFQTSNKNHKVISAIKMGTGFRQNILISTALGWYIKRKLSVHQVLIRCHVSFRAAIFISKLVRVSYAKWLYFASVLESCLSLYLYFFLSILPCPLSLLLSPYPVFLSISISFSLSCLFLCLYFCLRICLCLSQPLYRSVSVSAIAS